MNLDKLIEFLNRDQFKIPFWKRRIKERSMVTKISKYTPHQGKKECAKRVKLLNTLNRKGGESG